jgi:hypothetical protein
VLTNSRYIGSEAINFKEDCIPYTPLILGLSVLSNRFSVYLYRYSLSLKTYQAGLWGALAEGSLEHFFADPLNGSAPQLNV